MARASSCWWPAPIPSRARPPESASRVVTALIGIRGVTLTQHLNGMENDGLVTRRRDPENRRVHLVELTDEGEAAFHRMREAAVRFDGRLRAGLGADEVAHLERLLDRLHANVAE